jgi:spore coat-associated protein N
MWKMRRLLISLMTIAMVGALIGGGVYAAFSDTETSGSNQFVAGTLDLTVDDDNPWASAKVDVTNMKPGDSGVVTCKLDNAGTIDGDLTVALANIVDAPGATPEPEPTPDNGELSANMDIVLWVDANQDGVQDAGETVLYSGKLNAVAGPYDVGTLTAGATIYVSMEYSIDGTVGNEIQGDSCTFDIVFELTQA